MQKFSLLVVFICLFSSAGLFAQDSQGFNDVKGRNFLNAGIGLGSYGLSGSGGIPIVASFEHGFARNISAGVNLGFIQRKFEDSWKYTYFIFGARGSYHFNEVMNISNPKVDLYAGLGIFYRRYSFKYLHDTEVNEYFNSKGGDLDFNIHAGGRYMFNDKVGGFAELGYGISPLQLGITLNL